MITRSTEVVLACQRLRSIWSRWVQWRIWVLPPIALALDTPRDILTATPEQTKERAFFYLKRERERDEMRKLFFTCTRSKWPVSRSSSLAATPSPPASSAECAVGWTFSAGFPRSRRRLPAPRGRSMWTDRARPSSEPLSPHSSCPCSTVYWYWYI